MAKILLKRGTRAQLDAAATAAALAEGEPYLISDEARLAIASGTSAYQAAAMRNTAEAFSTVDLPAGGEQAAPTPGNLRLYGRSLAGRCLPEWVGGCGLNTAAQPLLGQNRVAFWNPPGGSNTVPGVFGFNTSTSAGTLTTRNVTAGSVLQRMRRIGYVSAATAGSVAAWLMTLRAAMMGNGSGLGGFTCIIRFGVSDAAVVAGARMFVGLNASSSASANVEPSTILNCVGLAQLSTSTNLHIVYGGSAAQAPIDLGPNFPANTLSDDAYEIALFAAPNIPNSVGYRVSRLNTAHVAEGTLTAATPGVQLPSSTAMLTQNFFRSNNTTALAVGLDVCSVYMETDY